MVYKQQNADTCATKFWMVKPLSTGYVNFMVVHCMNTDYIWLHKSGTAEKIDLNADQKQENNFVWPNVTS